MGSQGIDSVPTRGGPGLTKEFPVLVKSRQKTDERATGALTSRWYCGDAMRRFSSVSVSSASTIPVVILRDM